MKFIKTLALAAAVMAGSNAWANLANSMNVQFPQGANSTELVGTISGYDYDAYHFRANKGQLLTINTHGSDPQIQTALFFKGKANSSNSTSQVLPYTGEYELRVLQTRNDARKSNAARQYNLELKIENNSHARPNNSWVDYSCDGNGKISIQYKDLKGKNPTASVKYKGKNHNLTFDHRFSTRGETMVFTNKYYLLSLDRSQTKDPYAAKVYSFISRSNDTVLVQECQPK